MAFNMCMLDRILKEIDKDKMFAKSDAARAGDANERSYSHPDLDRHLRLCVQDFDEEFQIPFNPILTGTHVLSKMRTVGKAAVIKDIGKMVEFHVQGGYNLDYMVEKAMTAKNECTLKRLIKTYDLVTKATNVESVTLYRVCASFPDIACAYLTVVTDPLISFNTMTAFTENYPKVMMDLAFAYLIPDKTDEFCSLLKEAHMLYRYKLYHVARDRPIPEIAVDPKIISQCIRYTRMAIYGTHLLYENQIKFLKAYKLINQTPNNSMITVAENVHEAANIWKRNIRTQDVCTRNISDNSDYWFLNA